MSRRYHADGREPVRTPTPTPSPAPTPTPTPSPTPTPTPTPAPAAVLFARDVLPIFTNNGARTCAQAGCHTGPNAQAGQNLEAANAYASIVNVPSTEDPALMRVKPGDSANSYLYRKVSTGQMPLSGGPLPAAQIATIKGWIDEGAPND